jgi:hypothetical protein
LFACGVWLLGLGLYFILLRPALLPEDARYIGATVGRIRADLRCLEAWLARVFIVLGGSIVGAGVLTILVATTSLPQQPSSTPWAIALAGALTVALMSATNFSLGSDFKWVLLLPALACIAALTSYLSRR